MASTLAQIAAAHAVYCNWLKARGFIIYSHMFKKGTRSGIRNLAKVLDKVQELVALCVTTCRFDLLVSVKILTRFCRGCKVSFKYVNSRR